MTAESRWPMPPTDGYTVDDLFTLPDLPPHTELIDGSLVFVSPQRDFHSLVTDLLTFSLRFAAPPELRVRREMTVVVDKRQGPEPDISVVRAEACTSLDKTSYQASDVVLTVEVVSPESETRDRERKPQLYAKAGIPHFWRVENDRGRPVVYVYERDPALGTYTPTGIYHDQLKLTVPFAIDIDLAEIDRF